MHALKLISVLSFACLFACEHIDAQQEVDAHLLTGDLASRQELIRQLQNHLKQDKIILEKDVLTTTSELVLGHQQAKSLQHGAHLGGFEMREPLRFTLKKKGSLCILVDKKTNEVLGLVNVQCRAVK